MSYLKLCFFNCFLCVVNEAIPEAGLVLDPSLDPPTDIQAKLLRQIVLSGLGHHVAK